MRNQSCQAGWRTQVRRRLKSVPREHLPAISSPNPSSSHPMPRPVTKTPENGTAVLFRPFTIKNLVLPNRIVMAPLPRSKSPGGIPGPAVEAYYRRRAEGGVGLIVTEGTYVEHPGSGSYPDVPHFYGEESLAGWKRVAEEVHRAGGKIFPQ